jgi:tRNA(fMet)-specific endonuclease VapC
MSYLIDTDWVADYLKGRQAAVDLIDGLTSQHTGLSLITYGEIYQGIYYGTDPELHEATFLKLLRVVEVIGLDEEIMCRFARIRGSLRKAGQPIGVPDVIIAATAIHYGLALVTRNRRHYERIPGLKLHDPE